MFNIPRRFAGIKRFEQILGVLSRHGLDFVLEKSGLKKKKLFTKIHPSRPVEVRIVFEELGGSFIKLGQFLSLRPDLIPKEYCDELAKLQDSCESFPFVEVEHILKSELGRPVNSIFKSFDKAPVAAASIGQVHRAVLKNKKVVAVKIMRPGIKATFETDLEILDYVARLFKHHFNPIVFDPEEIFEEFRRYTEGELDYLKEAKNLKTFHSAFSTSQIIIPDVYEELTTRRVLVMDYLDGIALTRIINEPGKYRRVHRKAFCIALSECFMRQIFVEGFFHADPHPGNILFMKSRIGLLDFGVVGRVDDDMREKLGSLLIALVNRDLDGIVSALSELNLLDTSLDNYLMKEDILDELGEYYDVSLDKMDLAEIFFRCISIARKHKIKIPRDFVLLSKCLITLKGVCSELDPGFNIVHDTRPFIAKLVKERRKPINVFRRLVAGSERFAMFLKDIPAQSRKVYSVLDKAEVAIDTINRDLSRLTVEVRRESLRIILGVIIAAMIISASFTISIDRYLSTGFLVCAAILMGFLIISVFADLFRNK
jgi:ubiquinone biosynthesis protein